MPFLKENILIVDDDINILEVLYRHLASYNYHVYKAISVKEAVSILRDNTINLLITDLKMPEIDGFELIKFTTNHYPKLPILVVTGYPSIQDSLLAIKSGVVEYLTKPFTKEELETAVKKTLKTKNKTITNNSETLKSNFKNEELIGNSKKILEVFDIIERVKNNKATILINGESGTGKELIARAIHYQGKFSAKPFIAVNCGAIPENLLESELFGYTKGAFTGADKDRNGFFQAANGGTIFLDEIGNASLEVQAKLLRVLQEKEVVKVGSQKPEKIDLRVIAATNSNIKEMITNKSFREDLYYRLSVVEITLPPLRERKEDISILIERFLFKYGIEYKDQIIKITPNAIKSLENYSWPGNIRELENVIQRAIIMCDKIVDIEHLPNNLKYTINFPDEKFIPLKTMEKNYINKVLSATGNNKTKAAKILQIDRKTLRDKISDSNKNE